MWYAADLSPLRRVFVENLVCDSQQLSVWCIFRVWVVHRGALLFCGLPAVFSIDCNSTRPSNSALLETYTSAAAAPSGKGVQSNAKCRVPKRRYQTCCSFPCAHGHDPRSILFLLWYHGRGFFRPDVWCPKSQPQSARFYAYNMNDCRAYFREHDLRRCQEGDQSTKMRCLMTSPASRLVYSQSFQHLGTAFLALIRLSTGDPWSDVVGKLGISARHRPPDHMKKQKLTWNPSTLLLLI